MRRSINVGCLSTSMIFAVFFVQVSSSSAQDLRSYEYNDSDLKLNEAYRRTAAQLNQTDRDGLKAAQQLWIVFRDADCSWIQLRRLDCLISRTDERTRQLLESTLPDRFGKNVNKK